MIITRPRRGWIREAGRDLRWLLLDVATSEICRSHTMEQKENMTTSLRGILAEDSKLTIQNKSMIPADISRARNESSMERLR